MEDEKAQDPGTPELGDGPLGEALKAAFDGATGDAETAGPEASSVLLRLERAGRHAPRVMLRDLSDETKVLKPRAGTSGRYQLVGEIARGGVGIVLKGRDGDLGRDVAMKVIRPEHMDNPDILQRFVEEAQIGGQLQHPGIVPVYEMGLNEAKRPYFTMKLVKGKTLAALLQARTAPHDQRRRQLAFFERVCQAMAYAHSRGVVHRDLKPANIIIGTHSEVQVVDWGFAKVLGSEDTAQARGIDTTIVETVRTASDDGGSIAGSVMGTPAYMPPEQALGQIDDLDERADVFALGAILCEIVTGFAPYTGETNAEVLTAAARAELDDAHARLDAANADDELVQIVRDCLAPTPSDRPADAGVVASSIQTYVSKTDVRAREAQVEAAAETVRVAEAVKAGRLSRFLSTAVVLLVAVGIGGWLWLDHAAGVRAAEARSEIEPVLTRAELLRGRGELAAALEVAKRARDLAHARGADSGTVARADALAEEVQQEGEAALAEAAQTRRDETLIASMTETALEFSSESVPDDLDKALHEALKAYGFDVDTVEPAVIAAHVQSRPAAFAQGLASLLLDWSIIRRSVVGHKTDATRPLQIADLIDDDPWRTRLRSVSATWDAASRSAFLDEAEARDIDPASLVSLQRLTNGTDVHQRVIHLLERAQRAHPDHVGVHHALGRALKIGTPEQRARAPEYLRVAAFLRPESVQRQHALGMALEVNGRFPEALEAYQAALALKPKDGHLLGHLAQVQAQLGRHEEALETSRRASELAPGDAVAWTVRGQHLLETDPKRALELFRQAADAARMPHMRANFIHNIRVCNQLLGDRAAAAAAAREAVATFPASAVLWWGLGHLLMEGTGEELAVHDRGSTEAIEALRRAVTIDPAYGTAAKSLAIELGAQGRFDEAIAALRASRDAMVITGRTQQLSSVLSALGAMLMNEGGADAAAEALRSMQEALRLSYVREHRYEARLSEGARGEMRWLTEPEDKIRAARGIILRNIAVWYSKHKRFDEMARVLRAWIRTDASAPFPYVRLAHEYSRRGQWGRVVEILREGVRNAPGTVGPAHGLMQAWIDLGDGDGTIAAAKLAAAGTPVFTTDHAYRAEALQILGRHDEAVKAARMAVAGADPSGLGHYVLGRHARSVENDAKAAVKHIRTAIATGERMGYQPGSRWSASLAHALWDAEEYGPALEVYRKAMRKWPQAYHLHDEAAWYLATCPDESLRNIEQALHLARGLIKANPGHAHFVAQLGDILYFAEDYEGVAKSIARVVPAEGPIPLRYFEHASRMASALIRLGRIDEARALIVRLRAAWPQILPRMIPSAHAETKAKWVALQRELETAEAGK